MTATGPLSASAYDASLTTAHHAPATGSPAATRTWSRRVGTVVRVHLANPWQTLGLPWIIFLGVFTLNVGVWIAVVNAAGGRDQLESDAFSQNGAMSWVYVYLLVAAVQAMNLTFSFALGLGVTRRDYFAGTATYFVGLSVLYAGGLTLLAQMERATHGWWLDGYVFAPFTLHTLAAWQLFLIHLIIAVLLFSTGLIAGAVWVRWKATGLVVFFGTLATVLVALVMVASFLRRWDDVGHFFTSHSELTVVACTVPLSLVAVVGAYRALLKATPGRG